MRVASAPGPVERAVLAELAPVFSVREVCAGGATLRVLEGGAGRPLILVHGRGNAASTWFPLLPELARHHRVLAVDLPGFGASSAPPSPRVHDARSAVAFFTDPLEAWLLREGLVGASIVGHSLGGRVALELALRGAARPDRLVLIGSMGLGPEASLVSRLFFTIGPERLARALGPRAFHKISHHADDALGRRLDALGFELYAKEGGRADAARAFRGINPLLGPVPHVRARLPEIEVETLVVWGEHDEVFPAPIAIAAAAALPRGRLHLAPLGHSPHLEDPAAVLPVLLGFLRE